MKRTSSKIASSDDQAKSEEPDTKVQKDDTSDILKMEVCEFYSMPRIAPKAVGKYISKGTSFDIGTMNPEGNPWNFTKTKQRQKAREYVRKNKPLFIIGSPPCDQWSIMQNLNNGNVNQKKSIERWLKPEFTWHFVLNCTKCK